MSVRLTILGAGGLALLACSALVGVETIHYDDDAGAAEDVEAGGASATGASSVAPTPVPNPTSSGGGPPPPACTLLPLGAHCTTSAQCCSSACAENGICTASCKAEGGLCEPFNNDCCFGGFCDGTSNPSRCVTN